MARNIKSTYKVQFPIRSESTALDDIKGIDKSQYYLTFTGTPKEISKILNCHEGSVQPCAARDIKLKGCKIITWDRYAKSTPYGLIDTKTGELKDINGQKLFTIQQLAKILNYAESYVYRAARDPEVGKNTWKNERIVPIDNAEIRHYLVYKGAYADFYHLYVNGVFKTKLVYE